MYENFKEYLSKCIEKLHSFCVKVKEKVTEWFYMAVDCIKEGWNWAKENPREAAMIATGVLALAKTGLYSARVAENRRRRAKQEYERKLLIWDPSLQARIRIKKPMTTEELSSFLVLRQCGVGVKDALIRIGVVDPKMLVYEF